jgi:hypothetical protein
MIYVEEDIKKIEQNEVKVFTALKSLTQDAVYCNLCKQFFIGEATSLCRSLPHREKVSVFYRGKLPTYFCC